jgi:hypothetical protein
MEELMASEFESEVAGWRTRKISDRQKSFLSILIHLQGIHLARKEEVYPRRALNSGA